MISLCLLSILAAAVPSAPSTTPTLSLKIDGNDIALTNLKLQSATTTSGRPTFVVMANAGDEPIFVRATIPRAEPGSYTLRGMRIRDEGAPRALLNIDCRKDHGLPVLRHDGGTLVVKAITVDDNELITRLDASFSGEMSETSGAKHAVVLAVRWGS